MSTQSRPRGPLPRRVYWARRLLVAATAAALVVGVGNLLSGGSDATSGPAQATQAAAEPTTPSQGSTLQAKASDKPGKKKNKKSKKPNKPKKPPLAEPSGPCVAPDVDIRPNVKNAVAGQPVRLGLQIRTRVSLACTWRVSPNTLTLKVTSGSDDVWSTRECRRAVPTRDVILRATKPIYVGIHWSARRSDEDCSRLTDWAMPGWYHVAVAPLGGEPVDMQFQLTRPEPEVVTASPSPGKQKQR
jgi:hypothetical protein